MTRPPTVFELTPAVEQLLSHAYVPLLQQLLHMLAERTTTTELDSMMRQAGRALAHGMRLPARTGELAPRVKAASTLLNEEFGALTDVEKANGHWVIRGHGCPLSAITGKHPSACKAVESFLAELLGTRVHECCDRSERPRCCFEIHPPGTRARARQAR